jgi:hypothetical protein
VSAVAIGFIAMGMVACPLSSASRPASRQALAKDGRPAIVKEQQDAITYKQIEGRPPTCWPTRR